MAAIEYNPPKARAILTITPSRTSRLLGLPRELRDIIYGYVLMEPTRWDRQHQPGCPWWAADGTVETPPWRLHCNGQHELEGTQYDSWRDCHRLCMRRKGIGLLRASRQVAEETSAVFWEESLFCFDNAQQLTSCISSLSTSRLLSIRKLSFLGHRRNGAGTHALVENAAALSHFIAKLEELRELELPRELIQHNLEMLECLKALRIFRCTRVAEYYCSVDSNDKLSIGITQVFPLERCETCRSGDLHGDCRRKANMHLIRTTLSTGNQVWIGPDIMRQCLTSTHGDSSRFIAPVSWHGFENVEACVWGLPAVNPEERVRREVDDRKQQRAKKWQKRSIGPAKSEVHASNTATRENARLSDSEPFHEEKKKVVSQQNFRKVSGQSTPANTAGRKTILRSAAAMRRTQAVSDRARRRARQDHFVA